MGGSSRRNGDDGAALGAVGAIEHWAPSKEGGRRLGSNAVGTRRDGRLDGSSSTGDTSGGSEEAGDHSDPESSTVNRRGFLAVGGATMAALAGCSGDGDSGGDDEEAIRDVIERNARALENENLEDYMETMHPESQVYEQTEETTRNMFERYEMTVDLEIGSIEIDGDTADAEVEQTIRETSGAPDYDGTRSKLTHELRTYEGEWRIYESLIRERDQL